MKISSPVVKSGVSKQVHLAFANIFTRTRKLIMLAKPDGSNRNAVLRSTFPAFAGKGGSPEIKAMLNYIQNSTDENVTNEATRKLHQYVEDVKILPEVRREYMTFEEYLGYWGEDIKKKSKLEGKLEGKIEDIVEILEEYGESIPEDLRQQINSETDLEALKTWRRAASRSNSITEFRKAANL